MRGSKGKYERLNQKYGKEQYLVPYLMSSHPGSTLKEAVEQAARFVKDCIHISDELDIPHANGVCFEEILGKLVKK